MKISVISPSFNQGRFISRCLASVRAQKGDFDVEHILLDNCSTDETGAALARYQADPGDVEVKVIVEPDKGQTEAINRGFLMASGDVVCWLNTDEYYHDGALARVARYFVEHPEVDFVFGNCDFVDAKGNLIKHKQEHFYSQSMLVFYGCFIPSCASFIRRRIIDEGVLLDPEFRVVMDFDWYVRIAKAGYRIARMPESLASFTWHETNISINSIDRRKFERRLVQDRTGQVTGAKWWRGAIYFMMRYFWTAMRLARRSYVRLAR